MSLQKCIFTNLIFPILFLIAIVSVSGQADLPKPAEANYEAVLHVLISGGQQGDALPNSLGAVSREIKSELTTKAFRTLTHRSRCLVRRRFSIGV